MAELQKTLRDPSPSDMENNGADDETGRTRRLSLQVSDLPVARYWHRWRCCIRSKSKSTSYANLLENEDANTPEDKQKKAQETMVAERCLDATVDKIVGNLSWVNATMLAIAMKNSLNIQFSYTDEYHAAANNAWIYFFVIFGASLLLIWSFRLVEDLDEIERELELKTTEKLYD